MVWRDLIQEDEERVLPWTGGRLIYQNGRAWRIEGPLPREYGWYLFQVSGNRLATLKGPAESNPEYEKGHWLSRGYLVGDRIIFDDARVETDPNKLIAQTQPVLLVELGLTSFSRAVVLRPGDTGPWIFIRLEFPQGPEEAVTAAYQDRLADVSHIPGVTPPLDLAFRWLTLQRELAEKREVERQRQRVEEERKREAAVRLEAALKDVGTGLGRRALAKVDFNAAARAALRLSGCELLATAPSRVKGQMVVQYRFRHRRLECEVERDTLRIVEAGICLTDHRTGIKGDDRFTLESLPAVVGDAMDQGKLVVWRHAPGDQAYADHNGYED